MLASAMSSYLMPAALLLAVLHKKGLLRRIVHSIDCACFGTHGRAYYASGWRAEADIGHVDPHAGHSGLRMPVECVEQGGEEVDVAGAVVHLYDNASLSPRWHATVHECDDSHDSVIVSWPASEAQASDDDGSAARPTIPLPRSLEYMFKRMFVFDKRVGRGLHDRYGPNEVHRYLVMVVDKSGEGSMIVQHNEHLVWPSSYAPRLPYPLSDVAGLDDLVSQSGETLASDVLGDSPYNTLHAWRTFTVHGVVVPADHAAAQPLLDMCACASNTYCAVPVQKASSYFAPGSDERMLWRAARDQYFLPALEESSSSDEDSNEE